MNYRPMPGCGEYFFLWFVDSEMGFKVREDIKLAWQLFSEWIPVCFFLPGVFLEWVHFDVGDFCIFDFFLRV